MALLAWLLSQRHACNILQIRADLRMFPANQQFLNAFGNGAADFEDEPAARFQYSLGFRKQFPDHLQPGRPREDCPSRLEFTDLQLNLVFFRLAHIRWIGNYEIEASVRKTL